ncbi:hypothetical protein [Aquimarina longa]|uniref:hypothetical protein n=1 Tax=Aquimarina longa TaxID=1080221 RepID=UPI000780EDF4|nr:hypothetical protein [Aquimarina longa]
MKDFFLLLLLLTTFSCKNTSKPENKNTTPKETIHTENHTHYDDSNTPSENYLKFQVNDKEIKEVSYNFSSTGTKDIGLKSKFNFEIPQDVFDDKIHEIYFSALKNSLPHKLQVGSYSIEGIENDQSVLKKDDKFYCMKALSLSTYQKMVETYGKMSEEDFLKVIHFDFIVLPDDNNKFNIQSIKKIPGTKEFIEISDGKGMTRNTFLIQGNIQLKLMKISSKKEFIINTQFRSNYEYTYSDF